MKNAMGTAGTAETALRVVGSDEPDVGSFPLTGDLLEDDRLHEECGVFGVFGDDAAAALTTLGLHALQHRGQEAAGIVSFDGEGFHAVRRLGLVSDNFSSEKVINELSGRSAIGHNRYSTTGASVHRNIQPLFADLASGGLAVAHNGNLTNAVTLRNELVRDGAIFQSTSDTEVILHLVSRSDGKNLIERFVDALGQIEGAYGLVALTNKKMIGARDPLGIRPLVLGHLNGAYILCSETCALDIIGAEFIREIEPGEVVVISKENGFDTLTPFPKRTPRPCIFEYVYFSRPDSIVGGKSVYQVRRNMGIQLAKEAPADVDVVIPVPDSGVPAALGYADTIGKPFDFGIIRNHYVGRSFIEPTQKLREMRVKRKHNINLPIVEGKRVVMVDDSIVRGTTSMQIVQMMRDAGAREVHMRISSPPILYPCYYGIDTPDQSKLLAAQCRDVEEMADRIGVDSLGFLSLDGLYAALGEEGRDPVTPQYTDHCFSGNYPTALSDVDGEPVQKQLSFLVEPV